MKLYDGRFSNGTRVITPDGREGAVVNNDNPQAQQVSFPDRVAGNRVESFSIEQLREALPPDDKTLTNKATSIITDAVDDAIKPFDPVRKNLRKEKSGEVSLHNSQESGPQEGPKVVFEKFISFTFNTNF